MHYYGKLKKEGQLIDMTMSEFADYYREEKKVSTITIIMNRNVHSGEIFYMVLTNSYSGIAIHI